MSSNTPPAKLGPGSPWESLVRQVQAGDENAMAQLYEDLSRWTRPYFIRVLGAEGVDDRIHDAYLAVVRRIQEGGLREPKSLLPFVQGVVRNMAASQTAIKARRKESQLDQYTVSWVQELRPGPEQLFAADERRREAGEILKSLCERDRELLIRFYLLEHRPERICSDLGLTPTQFRLNKSRALAKLAKLRTNTERTTEADR